MNIPLDFVSGSIHRYSGPVHTYPDIFESATFSFRIRLSSTRIRRIRKQIRKFLNPLSRVEIFESDNISNTCGRSNPDTMTSQNWRKCLPRKFKYGRRSKAKSFCAPWAYFQSFNLYAAKCRSTKCWNKLCQKAARHLQALYIIYRTKRPAETT